MEEFWNKLAPLNQEENDKPIRPTILTLDGNNLPILPNNQILNTFPQNSHNFSVIHSSGESNSIATKAQRDLKRMKNRESGHKSRLKKINHVAWLETEIIKAKEEKKILLKNLEKVKKEDESFQGQIELINKNHSLRRSWSL